MPHLTATTAGTASTGLSPGLGIPGLAHPLVAPQEWDTLARPGTPLHWVVLNVSGGPGTRSDPHCRQAVGQLHTAGIRVLGHLDLAYGARTFGELISEAHRYLDWYQVDGFLLDRCPAERVALPEVRRTVTTLRALLVPGHIVLGHGTHPYPGYAEDADQLVTFSGSWSDYRWSQVAEWTADHSPERFCHFVHGVPRGHLEEALRIARWQGAATIWFTDRADRGGRADPWAAMPGYWDEIVSRIGTGVSE
ncbi:spherulation-specific family 4 protein [Streptomyces colonosanans]|uniref:Phage tail protein n=1 Tax=Streptomyces colonosanans TaxID=1428652 RepID=A0A1S2PHC4_9ACTN|nr:spherulation-specific family 4 protein [Streptomyces colonosanans]OIJ93199.1 phage tail protein [Streptomyces colonosanans]